MYHKVDIRTRNGERRLIVLWRCAPVGNIDNTVEFREVPTLEYPHGSTNTHSGFVWTRTTDKDRMFWNKSIGVEALYVL